MNYVKISIYYKIKFARFEFSLSHSIQSQKSFFQKERQAEQLQHTIGDHERTILKFRETVKTMQVCLF
jgi:hypothetical protein